MRPTALPNPELVPTVVQAALGCLNVTPGGTVKKAWSAPPDFAVFGGLEIVYQRPDALTPNHRDHTLHIWKNRRSVLRVSWKSDPPQVFKISKLSPGEWVDEVLEAAQHAPLNDR